MIVDRALQIIAAAGADPARWPDDERAGVLAVATDPAVAAALDEARALDSLLTDWATDCPSHHFDAAVIAALPQARPPARPKAQRQTGSRPQRRWLAAGGLAAGGMAMAASLALVLVIPGPPGRQPVSQPPQIADVPSAIAPAADSDTALFATVFTPTADEDDLI